jgi:hypothetical protein
MEIEKFIAQWSETSASERGNKELFVLDLCDSLGVARPSAKKADSEKNTYVFEADTHVIRENGKPATEWMDLYKKGHFLLEAKQGSDKGDKKRGTARRDTPGWNIAMRDAYGQAIGYACTLDQPPPFIIISDIGYCFDIYACFDGSGAYRPYPNATSSRIFFRDLARHLPVLRAIFDDPFSLDPSRRAVKVTREVATHLAELARQLEENGHPAQQVAQFLMRCIFTMFAEDVHLLPDKIFTKKLLEDWIPRPGSFPAEAALLWKAMNDGDPFGFFGKLLRFNGGLFDSPEALPLTKGQLSLLLEAARFDWTDVEPAIFGTLLERAINPKERHALGAHFTPRSYVERLVRPTIEEPVRGEWDLVQAEVRHLVGANKPEDAVERVHEFHQKLCEIRILDPACGSGNFLYVAMDFFKRLESEVLSLLRQLGAPQTFLETDRFSVTPRQFLGIEIQPWAKEITDLVLWIGYLQWHFRTHGTTAPAEPVLKNYGNIECRDALLDYDERELVRDEKTGAPITRWDGETYKTSPVTGEPVPDDSARAPVYKYPNVRKARWPRADYVVGNPPFVGNKRMRQELGDEYVENLRLIHKDVPDSCDYVMYWWKQAAELVRDGKARRFGLITTNSVTQIFNRRVIQPALADKKPISLVFAIPDHPWVDSADGAAVRIAMTVAVEGVTDGDLWQVIREADTGQSEREVEFLKRRGRINPDLTVGANVAGALSLKSNTGLCGQGMKVVGDGFYSVEGLSRRPRSPVTKAPIIREILNTENILEYTPGRQIIDFFELAEPQARKLHPEAFQRVLDRVKPIRDQNKRKSIRELWWRFAWDRPVIRKAIRDLPLYFVTLSTAKHRFFVSIPSQALWDGALFAIALEDFFFLGVLSSRVHSVWALAAGGKIGYGNDPTWTNGTCFDPFPFPTCSEEQKARIRELGEALDAHRKLQQKEHPGLTLTGMYNVLEKLRSGEPFTENDKEIHEQGLVSVMKQIHDDLDAAVLEAYGWPQTISDQEILERLVALNAERAAEEKRGLVRWLRPGFQATAEAETPAQAGIEGMEEVVAPERAGPTIKAWPAKLPDQVAAVRDRLQGTDSFGLTELAKTFKGVRESELEAVLETLEALGLVVAAGEGAGCRWRRTKTAAA